jgi:hypothetical protein
LEVHPGSRQIIHGFWQRQLSLADSVYKVLVQIGSEIGMKRIWSAVAASILLFMVAPVAFSEPGYHVIKNVAIPGGTSWDYVFVDEVGR